jgi:hypothetical protein
MTRGLGACRGARLLGYLWKVAEQRLPTGRGIYIVHDSCGKFRCRIDHHQPDALDLNGALQFLSIGSFRRDDDVIVGAVLGQAAHDIRQRLQRDTLLNQVSEEVMPLRNRRNRLAQECALARLLGCGEEGDGNSIQCWLAPASGAGVVSEGTTLVGAGPRWGRSLPKLDVAGSSPVARSLEAPRLT